MRRARIALFVLEALPNARAVARFVAEHAGDIALVGLSDAERPSTGGLVGQVRRHVGRSGIGILPYLAVNFGLPDALRPLAPLTQALAGRRAAPAATPLRRLCRSLGVPVLDILDVNGSAVREALAATTADLILTYHFDQILDAATIAATPLGGINVHPALLPRHRGPVPTIHALADGDRAFGVTVHRLAPTIDAGAVLAQAAMDLPPDVSATGASVALHDRARTLVDAVLDAVAATGALPDGRVVPVMPYRPFPDRALLRDLRRRRLRLVDAADVAAALTLHARG